VRGWAAAACAAALALGGCASVSDDAQKTSLRALAADEKASKPSEDPSDCRPIFASLRPSPRLPAPGRMPRGSFMHEIQNRTYLRVGVDQNTLGLGYFDPRTRRMEGFDIELVRTLQRAIFADPAKHPTRYIALATGERQAAVENDVVDLVASAYSITCDRKEAMHFSKVYFTAQQRLLVPKTSDVAELEDLRDRKVCATYGSTSLKRLKRDPRIKRHPVYLRSDCLVALQEGVVDAVTSDDSILWGFRRQDRDTKIVGGCLAVERYGLAINRANGDFVRFVNAVLDRLGPGGRKRIRQRTLPGLDPPTRDEITRCERR